MSSNRESCGGKSLVAAALETAQCSRALTNEKTSPSLYPRPFNITCSTELDDVTYKAMLCDLFIHKSPVLAISAMTEISAFGSSGEPAAAKRIHKLNSSSEKASTEKRKRSKEKQHYVARLCLLQTASGMSSLRRFCSMFEHLDSAQPWAKGDATNNGSSMSIFFLIQAHTGCLA